MQGLDINLLDALETVAGFNEKLTLWKEDTANMSGSSGDSNMSGK